MCLMMEWDGREWKTDEKTFLDVTDIHFIHFGDTKTLPGANYGIYMQFALKWDQTMLCLDNFYIS